MKFILFVEGHTEQKAVPAFLKRWLDKQLTQPVGVQPVRFDGWPQLVKDVRQHTQMYLNAPKQDVIAVISLLDLYGPTFYPADKTNKLARYQWAKEYLEKQVAQEKFRQFFAIHETEAWLFSDPKLFPQDVRQYLPDTEKRPPENVNFDEPPAKLLERLYRLHLKRKYGKVTDGKSLFAKLDPNVAYEHCPHLRELLDEMLRLAREAGLG